MKRLTPLCLLLLATSLLRGEDWPQFRGPNRDGVSIEKGIPKEWPKEGPKRLWTFDEAGVGYSGPAIVGDKLFTMGQRIEAQWLMCVDIKSGKELWATRLGDPYTNAYGDGPRGTPTIINGLVFALGANGELLCANAATGKENWRVSLTDLGGTVPGWGYSESPLVDGSRVFCTPGGEKGAVVALDIPTGRTVWQSKEFTDEAQYTSLMRVEQAGIRQVVCVNRERIVGLSADEGRLLWQQKFRSGVVVAQSPVVRGDMVYAAAAGRTGCKAIRLNNTKKPELVYSNEVMKNLPGGVVLFGEHLFGYSDGAGWVCQKFDTGEEVWASEELGKGSLTIAGEFMICLTEDKGVVVLADASPTGWKERSRFQFAPLSKNRKPNGRIWTPPVIAGGKLYLRDQELLSCFELAAR